MKWYASLFKDKYSATFATAAFQFVISLMLFFTFCVIYAVVNLPVQASIFVTDFQKYFILAATISCLIPVLFSFLLIIGLIRKKPIIIWIWIISALIFFPLIIIELLGSGIYLVIENAIEVGIPAIILSLLITVAVTHALLITIIYVRDNKDKFQDNADK